MFTVLRDNEPELLRVSTKVEIFDEKLQEFCNELLETMIAYNGIGIAAPQVGNNIRVIIVTINGKPTVMINPRIQTKAGFYVSDEGCLSVPNRKVKKTRSKTVAVEYKTVAGNVKSIVLKSLEAACVQHEIDHLNGILIG